METPTPANVLGVKGIGESGTIGSTPGRLQRRARRARALRRPPRRHALQRRERLARAPGGEGVTKVALTVNGERREADVEPRQLLVYFLRETLGLKGTNVGCDTSSCGACTVLARRRVGQVVHGARRAGRRQRRDDDRGARLGRRAAPGAAGLPRAARAAVRLLHAGLRHGDGLAAARRTRARRRRRSAARSRATSAAAPGTTTSCARSRRRRGRAHDPRRVRVRARGVGRGGDRAPRPRRGREAARRRTLPDPRDEAPHRAPDAARRHRPTRRPALRPRGRRPDRDRRAHPARRARPRSGAGGPLRAGPADGGADRRPAGSPPRHDRRLGRPRRSGFRPRRRPAHARRRARRTRP